jgi:biopolymer transport protein ExbB
MEAAASYGILESVRTWYGALLMGTILFMSVYMVALALVRFRFFRSIRVNPQKIMEDVLKTLESGDAVPQGEAWGRRQKADPPLQVLAFAALANRAADVGDLQELMKITVIKQRERLEKGQSIFGTCAAVGPFLGLLATVLGIIHSFEALAHTGAAGPNVVAGGVAEALWGTAAGLVLAIPAVLFYNYFNRQAKSLLTELELMARELLVVLKGFRQRPGKASKA